jgi:adenylate cyclase
MNFILEDLEKNLWEWRGVLIAVPSVIFIVIALRFTGLLQSLELTALDQLFLVRPQERIDNRIVIVEINEEDINNQKVWPISNAVMTKFLKNIKQQQPRAIGLDICGNWPVNTRQTELVNLFESMRNLIGIEKVLENMDSSLVHASPILKKLQQVGGNDLPLDGDGKIYRGMLYLYLNENDYIESLSLKLALLYLKAEGITEKAATTNPKYLQLGRRVVPMFKNNDGG